MLSTPSDGPPFATEIFEWTSVGTPVYTNNVDKSPGSFDLDLLPCDCFSRAKTPKEADAEKRPYTILTENLKIIRSTTIVVLLYPQVSSISRTNRVHRVEEVCHPISCLVGGEHKKIITRAHLSGDAATRNEPQIHRVKSVLHAMYVFCREQRTPGMTQ